MIHGPWVRNFGRHPELTLELVKQSGQASFSGPIREERIDLLSFFVWGAAVGSSLPSRRCDGPGIGSKICRATLAVVSSFGRNHFVYRSWNTKIKRGDAQL